MKTPDAPKLKKPPGAKQVATGLLAPLETRTLKIPIDIAKRQPLVISQNPLDITIREVTADHVTIENRTTNAIPFALFLTPKWMVRAARVDWKDILGRLGKIFIR